MIGFRQNFERGTGAGLRLGQVSQSPRWPEVIIAFKTEDIADERLGLSPLHRIL